MVLSCQGGLCACHPVDSVTYFIVDDTDFDAEVDVEAVQSQSDEFPSTTLSNDHSVSVDGILDAVEWEMFARQYIQITEQQGRPGIHPLSTQQISTDGCTLNPIIPDFLTQYSLHLDQLTL